MSIEAVRGVGKTGEELAREGTLAGLSNAKCYRCGRDPELAHGRNAFCPSFASSKEVGRWIDFHHILRAIKKALPHKTVSVQDSNRVEEWAGAAGQYHIIKGISVDGVYKGRFDAPIMPEFTLWSPMDIGEYGVTNDENEILYNGWRVAIRYFCNAARIDAREVFKHLNVEHLYTTEERMRLTTGHV